MKKKKKLVSFVMSLGVAIALTGITYADESGDLVKDALSAAPESISSIATVKNWDGTVLKEGSDEWVCYPSMPDRQGFCPMCLDKPWQKWLDALLAGKEPDVGGLGVSYMIQGDCAVSNIDPGAMEKTDHNDWVQEGPHLMIVTPDIDALKGTTTNPYGGEPYVMWGDTPYAHIMAPIPGEN